MILETKNGVKLTFSENTVMSPIGTTYYEILEDGSQCVCDGGKNNPLILIDGNQNLTEINLDGYYLIHKSRLNQFVQDYIEREKRIEEITKEEELTDRITKMVIDKINREISSAMNNRF